MNILILFQVEKPIAVDPAVPMEDCPLTFEKSMHLYYMINLGFGL